MNSKLYIILFFVIFNLLKLNAQDVSKIKLLNSQNGLSNGRVTSIIQDSLGFMWFGTKNGLNRYDGHSVRVYNKRNSIFV